METILYSWIGKINIAKRTILPKAIYRFNVITIKIPMIFFAELEQIILEFMCNHKRPWNATAVLREKKEKGWRYHPPRLQTILQSYSIKKYGTGTNADTNQWNRIDSQEINTHTYGQLIYEKGVNNLQWRKDSLFNKWC